MPLVKKPNSAAFCHFPMDSNAFPSYLRRTDLEIIEWNEIDSKSIPAVEAWQRRRFNVYNVLLLRVSVSSGGA